MRSIGDAYPELAEFLGAYFNQDFHADYDSLEEAVDEYVGESRNDTGPIRLLAELDKLLSENLPEDTLHVFVVEAVMGIEPPGSARSLLHSLRDRLAATI
jgi:hypothetical protein